MSLLGNSYQRITSKKIQERAQSAGAISAIDLANSTGVSEHTSDILRQLQLGDSGLVNSVDEEMSRLKIADALNHIMKMLGKVSLFLRLTTNMMSLIFFSQVNELMTATAPWSSSTDVQRVAEVHAVVLEVLRICGILLQPFIPSRASMLLDVLGIPPAQRTLANASLGSGAVGDITSGVRLFDALKDSRKALGA